MARRRRRSTVLDELLAERFGAPVVREYRPGFVHEPAKPVDELSQARNRRLLCEALGGDPGIEEDVV